VRVAEKKQRSTISTGRVDLQVAAKRALLQVLKPLTEFVIDAGLSTRDVHAIFRECAVRIIADRQLQVAGRVNVAGIAASTGIPRAEIARIIKSRSESNRLDRRQQSTNRILAAWHKESRFTNTNGQPAELRLYGRGSTFESLVKTHGRGIPTRALLDELVRAGSVEVLPSQKIRAKSSLTTHRGLNRQFIKAFGDHASELLSTMVTSMREPRGTEFAASVSVPIPSVELLPLIGKEISTKGAEFLSEIQENFAQLPAIAAGSGRSLSVTVFCNEKKASDEMAAGEKAVTRTNFRRPLRVTSRR
jgi:Family of unknown function (DUF6502)